MQKYQQMSIKCILCGDSSVGKSNIMLRFIENRYVSLHDATVSCEYGSKIITTQNVPIRLQVIDTAGQEAFQSLTRSYFRGSAVVFLVYDITSRQSFKNIQKWLKDVRDYGNQRALLFLLGNKSDREAARQVSKEEAEQYAQTNGMTYFETSAKDGTNINNVFLEAADRILTSVKNGLIDITDCMCGVKVQQLDQKIQIQNQQGKKQGGCC